MKMAQEVRIRRKQKIEEERDRMIDEKICKTFEAILVILDEATSKNDFNGIDIYAGEEAYKQFKIKPNGLYQFDHRLVHYEELVDPISFLIQLKNYIEREEGFVAELRRHSAYTKVLSINIVC